MFTATAQQSLTHEQLRAAIERNCGVTLSLPSAGMVRNYRSRFLAEALPNDETRHDDGPAFWLESVPSEHPLLDELVRSQRPVEVSFKGRGGVIVFLTPIRRREPAYRINAGTTVEAILLPFPEDVKPVQRRTSYRVSVSETSELSARVWTIGPAATLSEKPPARQELKTRVRDISVGGLGVIFTGVEGQPPRVTPDDRLRIELIYRKLTLVLEGRLRFPPTRPTETVVRGGVQFESLEGNLEGRQKLVQLTKIVGELQREEARRARLGV